MPPRLQPQTCQCLRTTRPQIISDAQSFRSFHASPRAQDGEADQSKRRSRRPMTKLRREMGEWLSGPGAKFRRPAFGSTNYLSAYDSFGNLKRQRFQQAKVSEELSPEAQAAEEEEMVRKEIEEGISDAERHDRAEARASERKQRMIDAKRPPPERPGDLHPYPLNTRFRSQPVLSEELREQLYRAVVVRGEDLQGVSAIYAVDARRVAAVVRLKTIEKQWMEEGKKLARPYSEAVLAMLPTTPYNPKNPVAAAHEGINDLPVHPATRLQLFQPTSESRHFTREDAAKAFSPNLLPADDRIAHPQLVHIERWNLEDLPRAERQRRLDDMDSEERAALEKKARKQKEWQERTQRTVQGRRWDFKFQDISAENVGKDGRSSKGIGARYGMPHTDRKSGEVKIPTSVE